jgi:chemotaxis signal transduction protein
MTSKVALFLLGAKKYALPVEGVLRIQAMGRLFPLPKLRQGVSAVFLAHGEVAPLLDLAVLFGDTAWTVGHAPDFLVLYGSEAGCVGLPADKVLQVVDREQGQVQELAGEQRRDGIDAYFFYQGEGFPLLFVDALLAALPS